MKHMDTKPSDAESADGMLAIAVIAAMTGTVLIFVGLLVKIDWLSIAISSIGAISVLTAVIIFMKDAYRTERKAGRSPGPAAVRSVFTAIRSVLRFLP